jgi:hypothetical protein
MPRGFHLRVKNKWNALIAGMEEEKEEEKAVHSQRQSSGMGRSR